MENTEWMYCELCDKETLHFVEETEEEDVMTAECCECHVRAYI